MQKATVELSIVLPAYREKENLESFIPEIEDEFGEVPIEIIVVDDNSHDGTIELLKTLHQTYHNIVSLERPGLLGIGSALRDGYNIAQGEFIVSSDCDLSFRAADMRSLYEKAKTGYDLVLGYRVNRNPVGDEKGHKKSVKSWSEMYVFSPLSNFIIRLFSGIRLRNYNTNFRIIRTSVWRALATIERQHFFLFECIYRASLNGARITEIPVTFFPRKFGDSKVSFFKQAPKYFLKLIRCTLLSRN